MKTVPEKGQEKEAEIRNGSFSCWQLFSTQASDAVWSQHNNILSEARKDKKGSLEDKGACGIHRAPS